MMTIEERISDLQQSIIALFGFEWTHGRAWITSTATINFNSPEAYSKYYRSSEQLRTMSKKDYDSTRNFLIDRFMGKHH